MPAFLWYGRVWEEERKRRNRKKRCGGENEEELGGIGLFGHFARISNSIENVHSLLDNRLEIRKSGTR